MTLTIPSRGWRSVAEDPAWLALGAQLADLPWEAFARVVEQTAPRRRGELLHARFRHDEAGFIAWALPELAYRPFNAFHRDRMSRPAIHWKDRRARRLRINEATAAPRGFAKSSMSRAKAWRRVLYGLEAAILVGSTPDDNATAWVATLAQWARQMPDHVAEVYGTPKVTGNERTVIDFGDGRRTVLAGKPFGGVVRGWNDGGIRPTLVALDDIETPERVRNPDLRTADRAKLTSDWMKLGPAEGGLEAWLDGTVLHVDSTLVRALKGVDPLRGWDAKWWKAVEAFPHRRDLWERYMQIYRTLGASMEARRARADRYLAANRALMMEGARVLDHETVSIADYYRRVVDEGLSSVLSELQNEPRDPATQIFDTSRFARCKVERDADGQPVIVRPDSVRVRRADIVGLRMEWDPSTGTADGDPAAIGVGLRDRQGYVHIVDGWCGWAPTTVQEGHVWSLAERWAPPGRSIVCGLEGNGFQGGLADSYKRHKKERAEAGKFDRLILDVQTTTENKEERIAGLEPATANGWITFGWNLPEEGMQQFDDFRPSGSSTHDDFPDMVERLYSRLPAHTTGMVDRSPT